MKKMLILLAIVAFMPPIYGVTGADHPSNSAEKTIKPKQHKKATYKSRRLVLKGPKAKNRKQWKDPVPARKIKFSGRAETEFRKTKK